MSKRKREAAAGEQAERVIERAAKVTKTNGHVPQNTSNSVIQIVTGSYERTLHGISATVTIPPAEKSESSSLVVQFADTFLFNAHASAIRCLALSPFPRPGSSDSKTIGLASGGTDEKINVYSLGIVAPVESERMPSVPTLAGNRITENPQNLELGSLMQHTSSVTALHFPTRSKLLSASEDNTISITRTKDLSVVSTIQVPHPKVLGQPSGDTAPQGRSPAGVNDFAIHPSMKLMVSVGKGEKCMRLWNLVTGKKAGVLNFGRDALQSVRESKHSHGEGRRIEWSPDGEEFAVAFERGVLIYGADSTPKRRLLPQPLTKVHQMRYHRASHVDGDEKTVLSISTEDGRVLFYSTKRVAAEERKEGPPEASPPDAMLCAELGGKASGVTGRIKDFEIIPLVGFTKDDTPLIIVTASSDGLVRLWTMAQKTLFMKLNAMTGPSEPIAKGELIGQYETGSRITCMKAFLMQAPGPEGLSEFEEQTEEGSPGSSSESESADG